MEMKNKKMCILSLSYYVCIFSWVQTSHLACGGARFAIKDMPPPKFLQINICFVFAGSSYNIGSQLY